MIDNRTVGKTIATLRQAKGMTQQQLAAAMSVSHQAVSKWENGAALPDIQTLVGLTQLFGITIEQLLNGDVPEIRLSEAADRPADEVPETPGETEYAAGVREPETQKEFDLKGLLEMAPFMSRSSVGEMLEKSGKTLTPAEIARFAPFVEPDCLERLICNSESEVTWDSLRRLAPFLKKEAVDAFARTLALGEKVIRPVSGEACRVAGDVWKTVDDVSRKIEKGVDRAVRKVVKLGEDVVNEVSKAFDDLSGESLSREARLAKLRQSAFERAIEDGRWDWLAAHIGEVQDEMLRRKISEAANRQGMREWVSEHLGGYADPDTIEKAIENGQWDWLGANVAEFDGVMQRRVAQAAVSAGQWDWLNACAECMELGEISGEIAIAARKADAKMLAAQLVRYDINKDALKNLIADAVSDGDVEFIDMIRDALPSESLLNGCLEQARRGEWECVTQFAERLEADGVEQLMEIAIEAGNFDAIDLLDDILKRQGEENA